MNDSPPKTNAPASGPVLTTKTAVGELFDALPIVIFARALRAALQQRSDDRARSSLRRLGR